MEKSENVTILRNKTVAFHTLGCKVNAYESEVMGDLLKKAGAVVVPFRENADVFVINTCSVTNTADKKSRQMLHRARKLAPDALIVATGCYTQVKCDAEKNGPGKKTLLETGADLIVGNNEKDRIAELIAEKLRGASLHPVPPVAKETAFMSPCGPTPMKLSPFFTSIRTGSSDSTNPAGARVSRI